MAVDADDDGSLPPRIAMALASCRTLHRAGRELAAIHGADEDLAQLMAALEGLMEALLASSPEYEDRGRRVLTRIQSGFPELWHHVDRELLWTFGGDCLHFLSDEEIAAFQDRDDPG